MRVAIFEAVDTEVFSFAIGLTCVVPFPVLLNLLRQRPDYRPLTKFENRGLRLGHGVWDLVFRRV